MDGPDWYEFLSPPLLFHLEHDDRDGERIGQMDDEAVRALLLRDGIDPEAAYERLRASLFERHGVRLPPARTRATS